MTPENIATPTLQERMALARSPETTDEILMLLAQDRKLDVRRALTERKDLSDQLMKQLVNDKSKKIRLRMAKHPELKAELKEILAESRESAIRVALALRDDAPEDLLLKLAADKSRNVGLAILDRKKLSDNILNQLLIHKNKEIRVALASRMNLPDALVSMLMKDESNDVVASIAVRKNLSAVRIERLLDHKSNYVRATIAARDDLSESVIEKLSADKHVKVLYAIANRGNLSKQFIKKMLSSCSARSRVGLAMKEPLSSIVVDELALDEDEQVRVAVAERLDIKAPIVEALSTDSSNNVRFITACRSDLSKQKSQSILSQLNIDSLDRKRFLLHIKKLSGAYLYIEKRKLVINDYWNSGEAVDFDEFGRLLPFLFLYPESNNLEEIVINIESDPYSFDQQLDALSNLKEQPGIKQISLDLDGVDLSWARCSNLNSINKQRFPNLEKLSISYSGVSFNLDLPNLKEISIISSGDDFHEIILMLLNSNLHKLERLSISAGRYDSDSPQNQVMNLPLGEAHEVWPNLKSLMIGTRSSYDWSTLFTLPLFMQLDELVINLDEYYNKNWGEWYDFLPDNHECEDSDEAEVAYENRVVESLTENITHLLDGLVDQSGHLNKISVVKVGVGSDIIGYIDEYANRLDIDVQKIVKQKVSKLKKLYDFNIEYPVYVGGYE